MRLMTVIDAWFPLFIKRTQATRALTALPSDQLRFVLRREAILPFELPAPVRVPAEETDDRGRKTRTTEARADAASAARFTYLTVAG